MLDTANVSTASDKILGRAATLLVQRDANAVASNNGSTSAKPWDIQDDGSVLSLKFGYTDCRACTPGDRDCRVSFLPLGLHGRSGVDAKAD